MPPELTPAILIGPSAGPIGHLLTPPHVLTDTMFQTGRFCGPSETVTGAGQGSGGRPLRPGRSACDT